MLLLLHTICQQLLRLPELISLSLHQRQQWYFIREVIFMVISNFCFARFDTHDTHIQKKIVWCVSGSITENYVHSSDVITSFFFVFCFTFSGLSYSSQSSFMFCLVIKKSERPWTMTIMFIVHWRLAAPLFIWKTWGESIFS